MKKGEHKVTDISRDGGKSLSLKVLEAMLQDVKQGNDENADAGFEIMIEPYDRSPIQGLGNNVHNEWAGVAGQEGSNLGVLDSRPPLPSIWSNLYSSRDLAFVSAYPNNLMFFSKLLAPLVHLYQQDGNLVLYV